IEVRKPYAFLCKYIGRNFIASERVQDVYDNAFMADNSIFGKVCKTGVIGCEHLEHAIAALDRFADKRARRFGIKVADAAGGLAFFEIDVAERNIVRANATDSRLVGLVL